MTPDGRIEVAVYGATGSIGKSAAAELEELSGRFRVKVLAARDNLGELARQCGIFRPDMVITTDESRESALRALVPRETEVRSGYSALDEAIEDVDILLCAISGTSGVRPVLKALELGKKVALASKEVLALAGELVMKAAARGSLVPIDSEHSGVFQCLAGRRSDEIAKVWLTASGGAFRDWTKEQIRNATFADALKHPTWRMGEKITVDSASLMNKALEVIEAHFLFGLPPEKLGVVINPQSIVHAVAELADGSFIAHMSVPDMRLAIRYALTYPERLAGNIGRTTLPALGGMEFREVDADRFPAIGLAMKAISLGGTAPAVLNAANEVAVNRFRNGEISFPDIWRLVGDVMDAVGCERQNDIDQILECDGIARRAAAAWRR